MDGTDVANPYCADTLAGPFCKLCEQRTSSDIGNASNSRIHLVPATIDMVAHCKLCDGTLGTTVVTGLAIATAPALLVGTLVLIWSKLLSARLKEQLRRLNELLTLKNKIKILVGCYQIVTQIDRVYEVRLPDDFKVLLNAMRIVVTFGFEIALEFTPLSCVGLDGYTKLMLFWVVAPISLCAVIIVGSMLKLALFSNHPLCPVSSFVAHVLLDAAPLSLQLLFLAYPIVTRQGFVRRLPATNSETRCPAHALFMTPAAGA